MRRLPVLVALAIASSSLAAPARADDIPPAFTNNVFQTVDVGTHPSFVVTAGRGSHYVAQSELATAAQEYGLTGTPGPQQLDAFVSAQQYDAFMSGSPQGVSTQDAYDMALGNVVGDPALESAYLVDGDTDDTLLEMRGIRKTFPGVVALDRVDLRVRAGSIIGSGTVSNEDESRGCCCIVELRARETLRDGTPSAAYLAHGDTVRIEMPGADGQSLFGAIEQRVAPPAGG